MGRVVVYGIVSQGSRRADTGGDEGERRVDKIAYLRIHYDLIHKFSNVVLISVLILLIIPVL